MIDHLSPSQIRTYLTCPKRWEFRYVHGIKTPPAGAMICGSAYHYGLAEYFNGKAESIDDVADAFSQSWDYQLDVCNTQDEEDVIPFDKSDIEWDDEPGKVKDDGITLIKYYRTNIAPNIEPETVENRKETDINGCKLVTITDLVLSDKVIDHKVKKKRFSDTDKLNDIQVTAYTCVEKKPFNYHVALRQKEKTVEIINDDTLYRSPNDMRFFKELVADVWNAIEAGIFPCRPEGWHCTDQWCGYWKLCRGKKS